MSGAGRGVALVGFMGAGKTTVGRRVAARLGWPFVDVDEQLVERFGPIARQVEADGIETFRAREAMLVAELCDGVARVVATGGGTFVDPENRRRLRAAYRTVWLDAPLAELERRIGPADPRRPLWSDSREARWLERRPAYARAEGVVETEGLDPDGVADRVIGSLSGRRVPVPIDGAPYEARLETGGFAGLRDAIEALGSARWVLVTEENVAPRWADAVRAELGPGLGGPIVLPAGEAAKSVAGWTAAVDGLLVAGVDRGTVVLALGGGALGDVAGFAAATTLRGLPWVVLPTTWLSMVDSAVGGKVAIDHPLGKNLVGAFHQPALVWAALPTLATLPPAERRSGWAEVVKTALVADEELFAWLEEDPTGWGAAEPEALLPVVERCVRAKARWVVADPREHGPRVFLNAGHTVGHAVEHVAGIRHGEAVAIGLVAEAEWAVRSGVCVDPSVPVRLRAVLSGLGLPVDLPELDRERLRASIGLDKKARSDTLSLPLPVRVGEPTTVALPLSAASELLPETR